VSCVKFGFKHKQKGNTNKQKSVFVGN